jgi:regulator of sigma E protease
MIITILVFIAVLSILVMVHELGHFLVARAVGVEVEEFGMGLPPRIAGKRVGKTLYSLNWLPVGGFVKLAGEDDEGHKVTSGHSTSQYFWAKTKTQRSLILIAGVTMNFVLAVLITAGLLVGGVNEPSGNVKVETVVDGSPAQIAGLKKGDIIRTIQAGSETVSVKVPQDLIGTVKDHSGQEILMTILRNGQSQVVQAVPRKHPPKGQGPLGVAITDLEMRKYSLIQAPVAAVKINLERSWQMLGGIGTALWTLISLQKGSADIAGPIGIAQVTGQAVKFGWRAVLEFMSILSLNLAVLNILPIPALDGGRLAFIFVEKILGRKVRPAFEKQTHQIGMLILMLLVLLVSISDIMRLARGG